MKKQTTPSKTPTRIPGSNPFQAAMLAKSKNPPMVNTKQGKARGKGK